MDKTQGSNIEKMICQINAYREEGYEGTTRHALSKVEQRARGYVCEYMQQLGMQVFTDGIGNILSCYEGTDPTLAPVWTGSHIDTVTNAGMFDGVAGIVSALEAIRYLREEGIRPLRSIYVNVYTCEESTVFGSGCIGSRALAGYLKKEELGQITDLAGKSLLTYLQECGFYKEENCRHLFGKDVFHPKASVELHIEQGPWLEREKKTIGIVDSICAPTNIMVTLRGVQSHAGGTSMAERADAFAALGEISVELEKIIAQGKSTYHTGTIGYVSVMPNAVNVIPGEVTFSVDIRDCDAVSKTELEDILIDRMKQICKKRRIALSYKVECRDTPMPCDKEIEAVIENSCIEHKIPYMHMISGAYHDSLFIGKLCPVAMIFVPSHNGISHSPKEWTDFADIEKATLLLKDVLCQLASE